MIESHSGWDRHMPRPRGGNRHAQEIADLWKQYARCQQLYADKNCNQCPQCKKALAGVGIGYVIYRCVRMLPSLWPPFWWTIPENAAVP